MMEQRTEAAKGLRVVQKGERVPLTGEKERLLGLTCEWESKGRVLPGGRRA